MTVKVRAVDDQTPTPPPKKDTARTRRRASRPDPPGVDPHPTDGDEEDAKGPSTENDRRLREDKPPHY